MPITGAAQPRARDFFWGGRRAGVQNKSETYRRDAEGAEVRGELLQQAHAGYAEGVGPEVIHHEEYEDGVGD